MIGETKMSGKGMKIVNAMLAVFVGLPIWFYILYQVLSAIEASELTWFLFWAYVPVTIFIQIVGKALEE